MMDNENLEEKNSQLLQQVSADQHEVVRTIPIVQETFELGKETIETNKIRISKKVTEHQTDVNIPLISEAYEVNRVPINQVVAAPPAATRQEGDTMIVSVIKEVLVVEKRYEIIEEIHITKRTTEKTETQHISLRQEEVHIERTPVTRQESNT